MAVPDSLSVLRPIRERDVTQAIVRQINELVRAGELARDQALPSERVAAAALDVSRPTLRAALAQLEELGVVERTPGGVVVRQAARTPYEPPVMPPSEQLHQLLEARRAIEPAIAVLACSRADNAGLDRLALTIQEQEAGGDDREKAAAAEAMFHRQLWRLARNEVLADAIRNVFSQLDVVFDTAMRTRSDFEASLAVHKLTYEAIASGRPRETLAAMNEHLALMERTYEDATGRKFARRSPLAQK